MDDASQVRHAAAQVIRAVIWLRDEEANASAASVADKSLAAPPCLPMARRRWSQRRVRALAQDDEGRGERGRQIGSKRLIMPDTCPGQPAALRLACSGPGSSVP